MALGPFFGPSEVRVFRLHPVGALVIHITGPGDKKELPPLIVQKSDGAAFYERTDLATFVDRVKTTDPDLTRLAVPKMGTMSGRRRLVRGPESVDKRAGAAASFASLAIAIRVASITQSPHRSRLIRRAFRRTESWECLAAEIARDKNVLILFLIFSTLSAIFGAVITQAA